jgi:hypothetical protein
VQATLRNTQLLPLLALVLAAQVSAADSPATGSICVAPLPERARELDHDYPGGKAPREYSYDFSVQIDSGERVALAKTPLLIDDLDLGRKHRVRIRDGKKTIESFSFTFESKQSAELCLTYGPWYQTWHLDIPRKRKGCNCK